MRLERDSREVLPAHMIEAMEKYVNEGVPMGDFLMAVFENNLKRALSAADDNNLPLLGYYVHFVTWHTPWPCNGSYDHVRAWIAKGGARGKVAG